MRLIGLVPTKLAEYDENGQVISGVVYGDQNYYVMTPRKIVGLAPVSPQGNAPVYAGVETYYYAFTDEAEAKQQLGYDEETGSFNVQYYPSVAEFRQSRQAQLDSAVVTTQSGKSFDADETSINRMDFAIKRAEDKGLSESDTVGWSTADVGTGVKVDVPLAELKEALNLAVDNMDAIWDINNATS